MRVDSSRWRMSLRVEVMVTDDSTDYGTGVVVPECHANSA